MKLNLDPTVMPVHDASGESLALAAWYDSKPAVRRLWGIRIQQSLRVILMIEATHDNSDVLPVWLACSGAWANELRVFTGVTVQLELFNDLSAPEIEIEPDGVIIADLYWRDSTLNPQNEIL